MTIRSWTEIHLHRTFIDISLHPDFLASVKSKYHFVVMAEVKELFKPRTKFSYKGTYGHGLLLAGSKGSVGAAIMSAKATLRSGAGLLTVVSPNCGLIPLQTNLPEAMVLVDEDDEKLTSYPDLKKFTAVGIGPSFSTNSIPFSKAVFFLFPFSSVFFVKCSYKMFLKSSYVRPLEFIILKYLLMIGTKSSSTNNPTSLSVTFPSLILFAVS